MSVVDWNRYFDRIGIPRKAATASEVKDERVNIGALSFGPGERIDVIADPSLPPDRLIVENAATGERAVVRNLGAPEDHQSGRPLTADEIIQQAHLRLAHLAINPPVLVDEAGAVPSGYDRYGNAAIPDILGHAARGEQQHADAAAGLVPLPPSKPEPEREPPAFPAGAYKALTK